MTKTNMSAYIATGEFLNCEASAIFCSDFDKARDYQILKENYSSRSRLSQLMANGDLERVPLDPEMAKPLGSGSAPRTINGIDHLMPKLKGSGAEWVLFYVAGTYGGGGWVSFRVADWKIPDPEAPAKIDLASVSSERPYRSPETVAAKRPATKEAITNS